MTGTRQKKLALWVKEARRLSRQIETRFAGVRGIVSPRRSHRGLRGRRRMLTVANAVAMAALESPGGSEFLSRSLREIVLATGMHSGIIYLIGDDDEVLAMVCQHGLPEKAAEEMTEVFPGKGLVRDTLSAKKVMAVNDLRTRRDPGAERWAKHGYRSFISAPITCEEKMLGVIALLHKKERMFGQLDSDVLKRTAFLIGAALEKWRRYEELGNALVSMRRMSRAEWTSPPPENVEEALERFAHTVCEAALALASMVTLMDGEGRVLHRAALGYTRQALAASSRMDAISARVLRKKECFVIPGPAEMKESLGGEVPEMGFASALCLPLIVGERPLGSLWLNYESPRTFAPWELEQLQRLADRIATAIEESRLNFTLRERIGRYRAMHEHCPRIHSGAELKDVLQTLADSARELLGARVAAASFSSKGISEQAISTTPHPRTRRGEGSSGGEATWVNTLEALLEKHGSVGLKELFESRECFAFPGKSVRKSSFLAVPFLAEESEPAGLLMVGGRTDDAGFTEDDEELLDALSKHGATAIRSVIRYQMRQGALREYRALLDEVGVATAIVNKEQTLSSVNRKFEELTGFSKQEVEKKMSLSDLLPEADREEDSAPREGKAGGLLLQQEHEALLRTKDGGGKKVKVAAKGIQDNGGIVLCLTELPEAHQGESPEVRGREIPPLQETVLSVLSHLHQAVASSTDYLDDLLQRQGLQEIRQTLDAVSKKMRMCRRALEELRVLAAPRPLTKKVVNINDLITDAIEGETAELRQDNIGVVLRLDTDFPAICADGEQLRWAIGKLTENARRAMRETDGIRTLTIQTERRGNIARITVCDTRPRVSSDRLESLFQLPKGDGESPKEPNLGLAACRAIIERHGWQISAECRPEEGLAFVIELPLPEDAVRDRQPELRKAILETPGEDRPAHAAARKVLVISREDVVIDFLEYYLRSQGRDVETSRNGRDAQRRLRERDYDLIFCALKMPGLSARELFRWLQNNRPEMARRVVFTAEDITTPETLAFLKETERRCLERPFDLTDLRKVIAEMLGEPKK